MGRINDQLEGETIMSARTVFHDSIIPLPAEPGLTPGGLMINAVTAGQPDQIMNVHFSLNVASDVQAELEARVAKGEVVPPAEIAKLYPAPSDANTQALVSWLKANGYEVVSISRDGVYARAKASQVAQTLDVNMVPVTKNGVTYTSAQNAPSLPDEVANGVRSINGLQPFRQANKHLIKVPASLKQLHAAPAGPIAAIDNVPPYTVAEIAGAYNANGLGVDGNGQTIAILIDTFPADSDLTQFWAQNGLPVTMAQVDEINVGGGPLPEPSGEETLDASWTSGIAPKANIRIYASGALSFVALDAALDRIIQDLDTQPGMRQLSISLGLGESFMSPAEVQTEHTKFLHLAAAGVNVFVSSGDAGSNPDNTGHSPTGPLQAEYEASDPAVIGVGGTTLRLDANGAVTSETGWTASGGGVSRFFPRPVWQVGNGMPGGTQRLVPDVSAAADPNTGASLVLNGNSIGIGGTSWSAPVWAGFCALINEARVSGGKAALGFLNPSLYQLIGTAAFRDITSGNNGAFHCGPGYDQVTGIGSPNVAQLIALLQ
jgi:kumamolisin